MIPDSSIVVFFLLFPKNEAKAAPRPSIKILINELPDSRSMQETREPELRWQCLNCYKVYKGAEGEQKALDCCGSLIQGWWKNYGKWGRQNWYGR